MGQIREVGLFPRQIPNGPRIVRLRQRRPSRGSTGGAVLLRQSKVFWAAACGPVKHPVQQIDLTAQTVCRRIDGGLVAQLSQQAEQHAAGAGKELAPQRSQHAAL